MSKYDIPTDATIEDKINNWMDDLKEVLKQRNKRSNNLEVIDYHVSQLDEDSDNYQQNAEFYEKQRQAQMADIAQFNNTVTFLMGKIETLRKKLEQQKRDALAPQSLAQAEDDPKK